MNKIKRNKLNKKKNFFNYKKNKIILLVSYIVAFPISGILIAFLLCRSVARYKPLIHHSTMPWFLSYPFLLESKAFL
jgi:hypothetical protein